MNTYGMPVENAKVAQSWAEMLTQTRGLVVYPPTKNSFRDLVRWYRFARIISHEGRLLCALRALWLYRSGHRAPNPGDLAATGWSNIMDDDIRLLPRYQGRTA